MLGHLVTCTDFWQFLESFQWYLKPSGILKITGLWQLKKYLDRVKTLVEASE